MTEESKLKKQIKDYLAIRGIFNYHILQGLGAFKGIPDRILHWKGKVIYLEIKAPKGKLSPNQEAFKSQCEKDGIDYLMIKDLDELIDTLKF